MPKAGGQNTSASGKAKSSGKAKANRRAKTKPKGQTPQTSPNKPVQVSCTPTNTNLIKYGVVESTRRLESTGFHPAVTSLSLDEYMDKWIQQQQRLNNKPSRAFVLGDPEGFHGAYGQSARRKLTLAPLMLRPAGLLDKQVRRKLPRKQSTLMSLLGVRNIGALISEHVFGNGKQTAQEFAFTSKQMWNAMLNNSNTWDFVAGDFLTRGQNGVFRVVQSEYTVGDFLRARDMDPLNINPKNLVGAWYKDAMLEEDDGVLTIKLCHNHMKEEGTMEPLDRSMDRNIMAAIRMLNNVDDLWVERQFVKTNPNAAFEPQQMLLGRRLETMVKKIFQYRASIKILHFEGTPYLDRRLLATVLRGCPHVTMVGVYDCPLIHFGDVLCILDLIHEINNERVANSQPVIEAFDFGPRFLAGMSFKHDNAAAYGLTWFPCKLDVVQRGFYMIILKAFMKARAMKLSLLFDENKAFRRFLFRVPNVPFAVPCFLDALHRYVEILSKGSVRNHERKQAIFDMLKPVRLNIEEDFHRDWPNWYQYNMDSDVLFCCSCGYEALQDFFTAHSRDVQLPHQRVCAGCILQRYLDKEICRAFPEKNAALDSLFPRWDGLKVNKPAPILKGTKVLHLKTIKNQRPQEPVLRMLENGRLESPQSQRALVVDGKVHWDSLEGLTALNCLADGLEGVGWRWGHFLNQCHQIDIVFRTTRLLMDSRSDLSPAEICLLGQLCPTGKQDHAEELQCGRDKAQGQMSHTFVTALSKHCLLAKDEWMPSLDGKGKTVSGVCDEAAGREFW